MDLSHFTSSHELLVRFHAKLACKLRPFRHTGLSSLPPPRHSRRRRSQSPDHHGKTHLSHFHSPISQLLIRGADTNAEMTGCQNRKQKHSEKFRNTSRANVAFSRQSRGQTEVVSPNHFNSLLTLNMHSPILPSKFKSHDFQALVLH